MKKEIKQKEKYESPSLNEINIKVQQCIASSILSDNLDDLQSEDWGDLN